MKIEFGVQEYFNELKLMDAQYGQEEELYPWIYMLLQMAECRKKEILEECYQGVSIRDVHNGQNARGSEIKELLRYKLGVPDIAIIDTQTTSFLGCVEIKKSSQSLNVSEGNKTKNENLELEKYVIRYQYNEENWNDKRKQAIIEEIKSDLLENIESNYIKTEVIKNTGRNRRVYYFEADIINDSKKLLAEKIKEFRKRHDKEQNSDIPYGKEGEVKVIESEWKWKGENYGWHKQEQILSHLEKFKKVLYTNGLEFYYLVLNEKNIDVKKIADLRPMYAELKNNSAPTPQLLLAATTEWDRLIAGLTSIDWHQPPVAQIPGA